MTKEGGFSGGSVPKNLPANAGNTSSIPGPGRSHMPWSNYAQELPVLSPRAPNTEVHMP